jgi:hypothetical protein
LWAGRVLTVSYESREVTLSVRLLFPTSAFFRMAAVLPMMAMCTPFKNDLPGDAGEHEASDAGNPLAEASATEGGADAESPCDLSQPFGPPMLVAGLANPMAKNVAGLRLSPDLLTGYFHADRPAGIGPSGMFMDLYTATRMTTRAPFEHVALLGDSTINTPAEEANPTVSGDGLTLVFARGIGSDTRLYYATRSTSNDSFIVQGPVFAPGTSARFDHDPFFRENAQVLYFSSSLVADQDWDIYRVAWNGSRSDGAVAVGELNTTFNDAAPVVTPDDLTIYFGSNRPSPTAQGEQDIWMSTRASTNDPFPVPKNVSELNSPRLKAPTFVSRDQCALYLFAADPGPSDGTASQYVAERPAR